jgi:hypothetical protein
MLGFEKRKKREGLKTSKVAAALNLFTSAG